MAHLRYGLKYILILLSAFTYRNIRRAEGLETVKSMPKRMSPEAVQRLQIVTKIISYLAYALCHLFIISVLNEVVACVLSRSLWILEASAGIASN